MMRDLLQGGASGIPGGGKILVQADSRSQTIIVRADSDLFPAVIELLAKIDVPPIAQSVIEIFELRKVNAVDAERILKAVLGLGQKSTRGGASRSPRGQPAKPGGKEQKEQNEQIQALQAQLQQMASSTGGAGLIAETESITITADAATNRLVVAAPPSVMDELIRPLLAEIDSEFVDSIQVRTITIANADVDSVAQTLEALFGGGGKSGGRDGEGGLPDKFGEVTISPDIRTSQIIIKAIRSDMIRLVDLVTKLDEQMDDETGMQLIRLEAAEADTIADAFGSMYPEKDAKGDPRILITADKPTNTVMLKGSAKLMVEIIEQIEEMDDAAITGQTPVILAVLRADPEKLAELLQEAFQGEGGGRGASDRVKILGSKSGKSLVVTAPPDVLVEIKRLAAELDVSQLNLSIRLVRLEHAVASEAVEQMREVMTQLASALGTDGIPQLGMAADSRTNSLIVAGDPAVLALVDQVKAAIDVPADQAPEAVKVIHVAQGAQLWEMAETMMQVINDGEQQKAQSIQNYRPKLVTIGVNQIAGVLLVSGSPSQFGQVERLAEMLATTQTTSRQGFRVIDIRDMAPGALEQVLDQILYPTNGPRSGVPGGRGGSARPTGGPRGPGPGFRGGGDDPRARMQEIMRQRGGQGGQRGQFRDPRQGRQGGQTRDPRRGGGQGGDRGGNRAGQAPRRSGNVGNRGRATNASQGPTNRGGPNQGAQRGQTQNRPGAGAAGGRRGGGGARTGGIGPRRGGGASGARPVSDDN